MAIDPRKPNPEPNKIIEARPLHRFLNDYVMGVRVHAQRIAEIAGTTSLDIRELQEIDKLANEILFCTKTYAQLNQEARVVRDAPQP